MPDLLELPLPQLLLWLTMRLTLVPMVGAGLIGLLRFRQLAPGLCYLTIGLVGLLLPLNLAGFALMLLHRNNLFLMPVYSVLELGMLAVVYAQALRAPVLRRWLPGVVVAFAGYVALDSWLTEPGVIQYQPGQQVVQGLLVLGLVGLYFRQLLAELRVVVLGQDPMFWVSAGLLIYFLGYLQIALFSNYLLRNYSRQLNLDVWALHSVLFVVLYCCYCRALWLPRQK